MLNEHEIRTYGIIERGRGARTPVPLDTYRSKETGIVTDDSFDSPFVQIPLSKGYTAIVSPEDADLEEFKWSACSGSTATYAARSKQIDHKRHCFLMHRVIMERMLGRCLVKGEIVDHINRNSVDNRRCNLRLATNSQNLCNRPLNANNTSGYKGVGFRSRYKLKWSADITLNGRSVCLGRFADIKDAARAYNEAALKYFGEFARLNVIPE